MKKIVFLLTFTILHLAIQAQQKYVYAIDIKNIEKDQISVLLTCPEIKENEIIFVIPRVIPGSYSDDKYAQFVKNFKALDASGNKLPIKFIDKSHFIIYNATKLKTLTYNVSDTWDEKSKKKYLFEPGGSNIESNKNIVLNNHAFFGYFEGYKNLAFEINVTKPETFFAS